MQKFPTAIALAYSADNAALAEQMMADLRAVIDFRPFGVSRDQADSLSLLLAGFDGPIVLLISDNFLRSVKCMQHGLAMINRYGDALFPVIVPGFRVNAQGELTDVYATFERVSDIIQYINYWQDRYLELRRQKREDPTLDNPGFDDYLRIVRDISAETGDFLRLLRGDEHTDWDALREAAYAPLFDFLGAAELGAAFANSHPAIIQPAIPGQSAVMDAPTAVDTSTESEPTSAPEPEAAPPTEAVAIPEPESPILTDNPDMPTPVDEPTFNAPASVPDDIHQPIEWEVASPTPPSETEAYDSVTTPPPAATIPTEIPANLIEKAWLLADQGDESAALTLLSIGLDAAPSNVELRYNYALLLAEADQLQAAQEQVQQLLAQTPDAENILLLAAEMADVSNDGEAAKRYYTQTLAVNPKNSEAAYYLAIRYMNAAPADPAEAARLFALAYKTNPAMTDAAYQLARLYAGPLQDPDKAADYLHRILAQDPEHPFAHYELALLHHAKADHITAHEYYQTAIGINPALKTPENDAVFAVLAQRKSMQQEQDTLQALKNNIERLETLLQQREEATRQESLTGADQCVLITGATSGIGKATAERFAAAGYRLILTGRREERLAELKADLAAEYDADIHTLCFDVRDHAAAEAAIAALPENWATIDILINNAGKAKGFDPIHQGHIAHWEEMIDTNIKGLLYLTRIVSPGMVARGRGHIINIASTAGKEVYPNGNVYCATKFAVDALTKGMRVDLYKHGIRVSQVAPAHVEETEFALVRFDGDAERAQIYNDFQPLRASDVAETLLFIAQQPPHVNILDVVLQGTQQASSTLIDRSGR